MVTKAWWKSGCVYQIWPASFKDSDGDGIGDIPGVVESLDYLKSLGIDIIWLSPMYKSPLHDMGYDISDYQNVLDKFGTMDDMNRLINECHNRGIKLILDLVVNHTSSEHKWFKESRSSKDNPKRDWYIWKPPKIDDAGNKSPPNNWKSIFGGSAWEWDELTQEYYLHLFVKEQPDLNWENAATRKAIYEEAALFWLDKGVDGFRIDTVNLYSKVQSYPDAEVVDSTSPWQPAGKLYLNGPRIHEFLGEMNDEVFAKYDCMTVGECPGVRSVRDVLDYVGASRGELNMVFLFDLVELGQKRDFKFEKQEYTLRDVKRICESIQKIMDGTDGWASSFIENHDQGRAVSRFLDDSPEFRAASSKLIATWLGTLSGTLFVYQGQEIGMINVPKTWSVKEYKDIDSLNYYQQEESKSNGNPDYIKQALANMQRVARDNGRTPMQWNSSANAGFTTGEPWMRVNESFKAGLNVNDEDRDSRSALNYWRKVIKLRQEYEDTLVYGSFEILDLDNESVFTYAKTDSATSQRCFVVLNFTSSAQKLPCPGRLKSCELLLSSTGNDHTVSEVADLEPFESRVYLCQK